MNKEILQELKKQMKNVVDNMGGKRELKRIENTEIEDLTPSEAFDCGEYRAYEMLYTEFK